MSLSTRQIETIAGLSAGGMATLCTHPLDVVKIRLQLAPHSSKRPFSVALNVLTEIRNAAASSKTKAKSRLPLSVYVAQQCYRGVGVNLVGNALAWAVYFALYAEFKRVLPSDGTLNYLSASWLAGISSSIVTNPIWFMKTRVLSTPKQKSPFNSTLEGVQQILRNEGILAFWKGTIPSLFQVAQASFQFTIYDHMKQYFSKDGHLSTWQYIYILLASKIASMSLLYPTQVVRSRLQNSPKSSIRSVVASIWAESWHGFYRGLGVNMIRVLPSTCIMFVTYETIKDKLSSNT